MSVVADFVRESNRIERITRDPTTAEVEATVAFVNKTKITVPDVIRLVEVYQPDAVPRFSAGLDVRIGDYYPPRGGPLVCATLVDILTRVNERSGTPYRLHCEYEMLHPFTDGNGRSGRALWLWAMGGFTNIPLGFLHHFYYQTLRNWQETKERG